MTEKELFCNLISAAMFPQLYPMPELSPEQYPVLQEMLRSHALSFLPGKGWLSQMPQALRPQWQEKLYAQKRRFAQYLFQQEGVLRLLSQAGIPCAILKGAVSASYYPEPADRAMGDIDILVRPQDRERAAKLLIENGFQKCGYSNDIEQPYAKASLIVELHTGAFADGAFAEEINAYLLNHLENLGRKELYGFSVPCLEERCNGLVMLEHLHHHFRDQLGFRQVIDWMMYVDKHLDDDAWNAAMGSLFREFGLETFAITVTAMCQKYFGLRREGISWTQGADTALCKELFDHIHSMGNFGKKLEANQNSAAGMLRDRSLLCVLKDLQKVGLDNWELCHRYTWLKPFAWLYQTVLYLYRIVAEGFNMSPFLVRKERHRVQKTLMLMDKLGLKE